MMNKLRKYGVLFSVLASLTALCGCSVVRDRIESVIWERSGISEDVSYQEYKNLEMSDRLDDEGFYRSEELERLRQAARELPSGSVHVSFARNDYLEFTRSEEQS